MDAQDKSKKGGIWDGDLLDRQEDAKFIIKFLTRRVAERRAEGRSASYVLNLDSAWGQGKTFFLERLHQQLLQEEYLVAYVNAWRDDYVDAPLIAVMSQIEQSLGQFLKREAVRKTWKKTIESMGSIVVAAGKGAAKQAATKYMGKDFVDGFDNSILSREVLSGAIDQAAVTLTDKIGDALLADFHKRMESTATFKSKLESLLVSIQNNYPGKMLPMFILVDELDRCRPTYAISMLEQIKHLFEIDNVVFVVATDSEQLQHSIRAVYGDDFDSKRYLLRFFDRPYVFKEPQLDRYIESLFGRHKINADLLCAVTESPAQYFQRHMERAKLGLRDADQCFDLLRNVVTIWPYNLPLNLVYLLPLVISYQQGWLLDFEALERGHTLVRWSEQIPTWSYPEFGPHDNSNRRILELMLNHMKSPISEVHRISAGTPSVKYVKHLLEREMKALHGRNGPVAQVGSVMTQYPNLVRGVARLAKFGNE